MTREHGVAQIYLTHPRGIPIFRLQSAADEPLAGSVRIQEGGFLAPAALRGIAAPTLLIWGRYDPLILPSLGARLAASIPSARIVYFEQSKHSPMLEEAKRFNQEVLGFLSPRSTR